MKTCYRFNRLGTIAVFVMALLFLCAVPVAADEPKRSRGQTLYVPVYSHIYSGDRERPVYLAATFSIRNTDTQRPIRLEVVDDFDSRGRIVSEP